MYVDPKIKVVPFFMAVILVYHLLICTHFSFWPLGGASAENEILLCKPHLIFIFEFNKFFVRPIFRGAISSTQPWKIGFWPLGLNFASWAQLLLWVPNIFRVEGYFGTVGFWIWPCLQPEHCYRALWLLSYGSRNVQSRGRLLLQALRMSLPHQNGGQE